jgi:hypothetical protein
MADRKITALTELTAPVATDVFPVIDVSESANANKNKKIQLTTILQNIPDGTVSNPSVSFVSDTGVTGFFRGGTNDIGVSANQTLVASFNTQGLKLGTGTAAAQLHLFSTDTTDQVIIENSDAGLDTAPDLVLYRNSASPAANDNLANIVFRANDSAGNAADYASIVAQIEDPTNASEDGTLDIMTSTAGTMASRIRIQQNNVGINEASPQDLLHITDSATGSILQLQCTTNDAASGADILLARHRGTSGAGQDNDVLSSIIFEGKNDNSTPAEVDYATIEAKIIDASDESEDGQLNFKVQAAGGLSTQLSIDASLLTLADGVNFAFNTSTGTKIGTATTQKLAFFNATPVVQQSAIANITTTASSGTLPTANGSITIANAASATTTELLEFCVELESKLESTLAVLRTFGLIAT